MQYNFWNSFIFKNLAGGIVFALPLVIHAFPMWENLTVGTIANFVVHWLSEKYLV